MLFNSFAYALFFPFVAIVYFVLPYRFRWVLLLVASYYFYMSWKAEYIVLIVISTLVDYSVALCIARASTKSQQKKFVLLSLLVNFGLLFTFKYFNFFNTSLREVLNYGHFDYVIPNIAVILPIGISFYTFQTLSYTLDVYREKVKPEKNLGIFALYVSFFPQLVAGPIERPNRLLPQFYQKHTFDYQRVTDGMKLMAWGFFKKLVIADNIAQYVDVVYGNPSEYRGFPIIVATYLFAFQIYCDFSGYSDIAIGSAQVMGYQLVENFKRPYLSHSIPEFWTRWHISLSTWYKDYVYIPLGGNRVSLWRWYFNIMIVFGVSGLWHGANWTFLIWGALHGVYCIISKQIQSIKAQLYARWSLNHIPKGYHIFQKICTFHLVCFSWIFFRANSVSDALSMIRNMFILRLTDISMDKLFVNFGGLEVSKGIFLGIIFLAGVEICQERFHIRSFISRQPFVVRWSLYYLFLLLLTTFGAVALEKEFIYFQF